MLCVAAPPAEGPTKVRDIARILDIPTTTLAKVIQSLARHGLVVSRKGPGGGVVLGRSSDSVTLLDVVEIIDGPALRTMCVLGVPGCSELSPHCPLHEQWRKIRGEILGVLGARSLKDLSRDLVGDDYVLGRAVADLGGGEK